MAGYIEYRIALSQYNAPVQVTPGENCNSITFFNAGTSIMVVDGVNYYPGNQLPVIGSIGEIIRQPFALGFSGTGDNLAIIYRKIYVNV